MQDEALGPPGQRVLQSGDQHGLRLLALARRQRLAADPVSQDARTRRDREQAPGQRWAVGERDHQVVLEEVPESLGERLGGVAELGVDLVGEQVPKRLEVIQADLELQADPIRLDVVLRDRRGAHRLGEDDGIGVESRRREQRAERHEPPNDFAHESPRHRPSSARCDSSPARAEPRDHSHCLSSVTRSSILRL
jgi:hypothetical protein